mgnify:FL=1|tara:strand:+ start:2386 stop:3663 length:1278 start_codon:yes stop_codon:yes gene_type:complete
MSFKLYNFSEIIASTPLDHDHSVGFHDIRPFNKTNNNLLILHKYSLKSLGFKTDNNDKIDICIWDYENSKIQKIDETNTYSWEQGSRLQWYDKDKIIYNKIDNGNETSIIYDIVSKDKIKLTTCIYSINKNGNILSINYSRLWKLWKSYGYKDLKSINDNKFESKPKNDGIYLINRDFNKNIIFSIDDAVNLCGLNNIKKDFFLCHPTFNFDGDKFVSLLRYFNDSGALISYLICTNLNNGENVILAREKVSHFEWITNNEIIVWCRNLNPKIIKLRTNGFLEKNIFPTLRKIINFSSIKMKNKILSNSYYSINIKKPSNMIKINNDLLNEDGHPQISPNNRFLITDTYANNKGYMKLILFDLLKSKSYLIGEFKLAEYLINNKLKYDLHPRWDNSGKLLNIDSSHLDSRQNFVIDISNLLSKIE